MANMKNVKIEVQLLDQFKIESRVRGHMMLIEQPASGGGADAGPTPLEYLLLALAGCLASVARIVAYQKKITLRSMRVAVEGDLDLDVITGKNRVDRPGFKEIRIGVAVDADMLPAEKEAFLKEVERRCPVSDNIISPAPRRSPSGW